MKSTNLSCTLLTIIAINIHFSSAAWAQEGVPPYHNLRFEEDYSEYPSEGSDSFFDPLKKIELSDSVWMSIGGETRARFEFWDNFGFNSANDDVATFYRAFLHTDLHFGEHWRFFLEGRFGSVIGRELPGGRRDALDADYGDIWNTFVEANYDIGGIDTMVRVGRQELQYGKERLISPLDWSNNRRIFEGGLVRLRGPDGAWTADFFVTSPVIIDRNEFNERDDDHLFSGAYATRKFTNSRVAGVDIYALALNSINDAAVDEDRYTLGGRVWGEIIENVSYDFEAAYQFGDLDAADIRAFMLAAEVDYTFSDVRYAPWIGLGVGYASGDDDPADGDVETFNQLFPLGHAFLGSIDAVGRQNIIDLRATVGAWPVAKTIRVRADLHFFWLADDDDALYNAGGGVLRAGNGTENEVGTELDLTVLYKMNRYTSVLAGYNHFFAGDLIDQTGPSDDIDFFYTQLTFTF